MRKSIHILIIVCLLTTWGCACLSQTQSFISATFQSLLARVKERDPQSHAIMRVKASADARAGLSALNFSLEKVADGAEVLVTLTADTKPGEPTQVYEQYRLRIDSAIQQEWKNRAILETDQEFQQGVIHLKVQHLDQDAYFCVPTCAAMTLAYFGDNRDPTFLKDLSTPPGSTFAGTYFRDMVAGIGKIGYHWKYISYEVNGEGFDKGLEDIITCLKDHRPVMVDLFVSSIGHTVLLIGYNLKAHQLFYLDPDRISPYVQTFTNIQFEQIWHSVVSNSRGAIFTRPKN